MSCTCSLSVSVSKSNDAVISTPNHLLGEKMMVVVVVLPGYSFSIEKRWWVWDRMMMRGMREVLLSSFKGLKSKESRGKKSLVYTSCCSFSDSMRDSVRDLPWVSSPVMTSFSVCLLFLLWFFMLPFEVCGWFSASSYVSWGFSRFIVFSVSLL